MSASERILPGTSFTEITEGLLSQPAVGSVGALLVGTASKGPVDTPVFFGSGDLLLLQRMFGPLDPFSYADGGVATNPVAELTLVRAANLLFDGGGPPGGVWVVRAAESGVTTALATAIQDDDLGWLAFAAAYPGQWYNHWQVTVTNSKTADNDPNADTGVMLFEFAVPSDLKMDTFKGATHKKTLAGNKVFQADPAFVVEVGQIGASVPTIAEILTALNGDVNVSTHFTVTHDINAGTGTAIPTLAQADLLLDADGGGSNWNVMDGTEIPAADIRRACGLLIKKTGRYLVIAGAHESNTLQPEGVSHVLQASSSGNDNERSFVTGYMADTSANVISAVEADTQSDPRVIPVAPGVIVANPTTGMTYSSPAITDTPTTETMGSAYSAAIYVGIITKRVPDESPLNESLNVLGLEHDFSQSDSKRVIAARCSLFALGSAGVPVVRKAITSAPAGDAFVNITTRAIVDEIRYAFRLLGSLFIGRKNNVRVRSTLQRLLQATLDDYVSREVIDVENSVVIAATRNQEILGVMKVDAVIKPVFFAEFIEFSLLLQ